LGRKISRYVSWHSPFSDISRGHELWSDRNLLGVGAKAKAERLGDVWCADVGVEIEVGDRSCDAKRPVVAARGERASLCRLYQKAVSVAGEAATRIQPAPRSARVAFDIGE
jgi:hypothetical protein